MTCGREGSQTMNAKCGKVLAAVSIDRKAPAVTGLLVDRDVVPIISFK